jgi:glycosyltransferase involved in cell wall biosynthesis
VIASNVGGIPEIIHDGENGLLVANEPTAIAAALQRIDAALGRAARTTVIQHYSEAQMVRATVAAYQRALKHV